MSKTQKLLLYSLSLSCLTPVALRAHRTFFPSPGVERVTVVCEQMDGRWWAVTGGQRGELCKSPVWPVNSLGASRRLWVRHCRLHFPGVIFLLHWITLEDDGNDKGEQIRCQTDQAEHISKARRWFKICVFYPLKYNRKGTLSVDLQGCEPLL